MSAWNGWYHVTSNTYGTWLPGDPRGYRTRHHRRHVQGDYKTPPPPGAHDKRHHKARREMRYPPVHLTRTQRELAGKALIEMLVQQDIELLCLSVDAVHVHLVGRFGMRASRPIVGRAKKNAYHILVAHGHKGSVWATRSRSLPVRDRKHQLNAYHYILGHAERGAWTWNFKDGLHWLRDDHPLQKLFRASKRT